MSDFANAAAQFEDNFRRIGGEAAAATDPEKYNLYKGLANLARLRDLESKVQHIQRKVQRG